MTSPTHHQQYSSSTSPTSASTAAAAATASVKSSSFNPRALEFAPSSTKAAESSFTLSSSATAFHHQSQQQQQQQQQQQYGDNNNINTNYHHQYNQQQEELLTSSTEPLTPQQHYNALINFRQRTFGNNSNHRHHYNNNNSNERDNQLTEPSKSNRDLILSCLSQQEQDFLCKHALVIIDRSSEDYYKSLYTASEKRLRRGVRFNPKTAGAAGQQNSGKRNSPTNANGEASTSSSSEMPYVTVNKNLDEYAATELRRLTYDHALPLYKLFRRIFDHAFSMLNLLLPAMKHSFLFEEISAIITYGLLTPYGINRALFVQQCGQKYIAHFNNNPITFLLSRTILVFENAMRWGNVNVDLIPKVAIREFLKRKDNRQASFFVGANIATETTVTCSDAELETLVAIAYEGGTMNKFNIDNGKSLQERHDRLLEKSAQLRDQEFNLIGDMQDFIIDINHVMGDSFRRLPLNVIGSALRFFNNVLSYIEILPFKMYFIEYCGIPFDKKRHSVPCSRFRFHRNLPMELLPESLQSEGACNTLAAFEQQKMDLINTPVIYKDEYACHRFSIVDGIFFLLEASINSFSQSTFVLTTACYNTLKTLFTFSSHLTLEHVVYNTGTVEEEVSAETVGGRPGTLVVATRECCTKNRVLQMGHFLTGFNHQEHSKMMESMYEAMSVLVVKMCHSTPHVLSQCVFGDEFVDAETGEVVRSGGSMFDIFLRMSEILRKEYDKTNNDSSSNAFQSHGSPTNHQNNNPNNNNITSSTAGGFTITSCSQQQQQQTAKSTTTATTHQVTESLAQRCTEWLAITVARLGDRAFNTNHYYISLARCTNIEVANALCFAVSTAPPDEDRFIFQLRILGKSIAALCSPYNSAYTTALACFSAPKNIKRIIDALHFRRDAHRYATPFTFIKNSKELRRLLSALVHIFDPSNPLQSEALKYATTHKAIDSLLRFFDSAFHLVPSSTANPSGSTITVADPLDHNVIISGGKKSLAANSVSLIETVSNAARCLFLLTSNYNPLCETAKRILLVDQEKASLNIYMNLEKSNNKHHNRNNNNNHHHHHHHDHHHHHHNRFADDNISATADTSNTLHALLCVLEQTQKYFAFQQQESTNNKNTKTTNDSNDDHSFIRYMCGIFCNLLDDPSFSTTTTSVVNQDGTHFSATGFFNENKETLYGNDEINTGENDDDDNQDRKTIYGSTLNDPFCYNLISRLNETTLNRPSLRRTNYIIALQCLFGSSSNSSSSSSPTTKRTSTDHQDTHHQNLLLQSILRTFCVVSDHVNSDESLLWYSSCFLSIFRAFDDFNTVVALKLLPVDKTATVVPLGEYHRYKTVLEEDSDISRAVKALRDKRNHQSQQQYYNPASSVFPGESSKQIQTALTATTTKEPPQRHNNNHNHELKINLKLNLMIMLKEKGEMGETCEELEALLSFLDSIY